MKSAPLLLAGLWLCPLAVWAAPPSGTPAASAESLAPAASGPAASSAPALPAAEAPGAAQAASGAPRDPIEPNVRHIVIEGENTRIEELRVRGQTQSVVVTTKGGARYEMVIGDNSRDLSSDGGAQKGAAGQRVWRVLSF